MQQKPTFLHQSRPLITCMVQAHTPERTIELARNAAYDGCDAYGVQYEQIDFEYRTQEQVRGMFRQMGNKPIYVTNYRYNRNEGKFTDDELYEGLMFLLENGATLLDVMGDYFCPDEIQVTRDPEAVRRQKKMISEIHAAGGEVLMSSHVLKFIPPEQVLEIALEHQDRGADIAKIVTAANSEEEELENLRAVELLKKKLDIPFLFLAGGSHYKMLRTVGPMLGCCMWLTVQQYDELATKSQPICRAIRAILDNFDYMPDRSFG